MKEIKNKTLTLGEGKHRNIIYTDCIFKNCSRTIFDCCKFVNCKFKGNVHVSFKSCDLDKRTTIC